ncbi:MAG: hypothetical protein KBS81_08305, partial [Spirochaetales bacterium]|nr:hypothetical protein [Candidatus Physcosoma equi]
MHRQFVRLFLSIALVIIASIMIQVLCVTVFSRQVVYSWSESVLDEFAKKIEESVDDYKDDPNVILAILSSSMNERISGFILRSANGQIVTFGNSSHGIPVPQLTTLGQDNTFVFMDSASRSERRKSATNKVLVPRPKYRVDIKTRNQFTLEAEAVSFSQTGEEGSVVVLYPDVIKKADI